MCPHLMILVSNQGFKTKLFFVLDVFDSRMISTFSVSVIWNTLRVFGFNMVVVFDFGLYDLISVFNILTVSLLS